MSLCCHNRMARCGSWLRRVGVGCGFVLATAQALGFGEPIPELVNRIRKGEYPRDMASTMSAREFNVRNLDDSSKTVAAQEGVQLAAAIMSLAIRT